MSMTPKDGRVVTFVTNSGLLEDDNLLQCMKKSNLR